MTCRCLASRAPRMSWGTPQTPPPCCPAAPVAATAGTGLPLCCLGQARTLALGQRQTWTPWAAAQHAAVAPTAPRTAAAPPVPAAAGASGGRHRAPCTPRCLSALPWHCRHPAPSRRTRRPLVAVPAMVGWCAACCSPRAGQARPQRHPCGRRQGIPAHAVPLCRGHRFQRLACRRCCQRTLRRSCRRRFVDLCLRCCRAGEGSAGTAVHVSHPANAHPSTPPTSACHQAPSLGVLAAALQLHQ